MGCPRCKIRPKKKTTETHKKKKAYPDSSVTKQVKICCNCKKTRCLKLYCECFRAGVFCKDCNCVSCANIPENEEEKIKVT